VSERSLAISRARFPGREDHLRIEDERLPLPSATVDLCFSACVFHHIPQSQHLHWLSELRRVTKPGGLLTIFEHNPWNPLTVAAVNSCPFDENARLLRARELRAAMRAAGWRVAGTSYRVFFPHALAALRPLERYLRWLGLGAQYSVTARNTP
jgi:SAM-dependent methyltransferase